MAASQSQYRIVISLRDGGGILVERQLELGGQFKTIDRYNTHDLTKELKRTDSWIAQVIELCSQPTAAIEIAIPKVPPLLPTQAERLAAYDAKARELEMQAQHDAEFRVPPCATPVVTGELVSLSHPEKPLAATLLEGSWDVTDKQREMLESDNKFHIYGGARHTRA